MNLLRIFLAMTIIASGCGGGSSLSTCDEYAADVMELIDAGASGDEIESFLEGTEEQVARLISQDPDRAAPCVEAVFAATFAAGFAELGLLLED